MKINQAEFNTNTSTNIPESKYYTRAGLETFLDEESFPRLSEEGNKVYAKAIRNKPSKHFSSSAQLSYSYYIMSEPNKKLFNPIDYHSVQPKISKSFINKVCKSMLLFTEVSEATFNKYLNFLKTENIQWLINAQRDLT